MSEKRFLKNFEEYHEYNLSGAKKLIIKNNLLLNPIRDYVQHTLVFVLYYNTVYFLSEFEVLENNIVLPKSQYTIIIIIIMVVKHIINL